MDGSTLYLPPTEDSESWSPEPDGQQSRQYARMSSSHPSPASLQQYNLVTDQKSQQCSSGNPVVDMNPEIKQIPPKSDEVSFLSAIVVFVFYYFPTCITRIKFDIKVFYKTI